MTTTSAEPSEVLRVLFCIGVLPEFYGQPAADFDRLMQPFAAAFDDLGRRFGIEVLGTLDDICLQAGPSAGWPWTCYILATTPSHAAVRQVLDQLMTIRVGEHRMWRYAKVEARLGPPLTFGRS